VFFAEQLLAVVAAQQEGEPVQVGRSPARSSPGWWPTYPASERPAHPAGTPTAHFDAIVEELNERPRQTLGFKTPSQALAEVLR